MLQVLDIWIYFNIINIWCFFSYNKFLISYFQKSFTNLNLQNEFFGYFI